MDSFDLPPLLWHTLKQKLNPSEELEVKRILGWTVVEHNEDLHQEATQLVEILHEYRERIDSQEQCCAQLQLERDPEFDFLRTEIATFVTALRKKGLEPAPIHTRPFSACEQRPVTPAADPLQSLSSHKSAHVSRLDVRRPSSSFGRPSTACFSSRSLAAASDYDVVDSASSLNIETVESCASNLRLRLRREEDNLLQNIAILHLALEDEGERGAGATSRPTSASLSRPATVKQLPCAAEEPNLQSSTTMTSSGNCASDVVVQDALSNLTFGGDVFCGNAVAALRKRKGGTAAADAACSAASPQHAAPSRFKELQNWQTKTAHSLIRDKVLEPVSSISLCLLRMSSPHVSCGCR